MKMDDIINRQEAIDAAIDASDEWDGASSLSRADMIKKAIDKLPHAVAVLTEQEKKILSLLFKICNEILNACGDHIEVDWAIFNQNDLFYLAEKLGIDY